MNAPDWSAAVLDFWFGEPGPDGVYPFREAWFRSDPVFDVRIRERFESLWQRAAAGELDTDIDAAERCLALILVLDQFPRNLFRGSSKAFASDERARQWARTAVDKGWDLSLQAVQRCFVYLPFEHSERLADQARSLSLFDRLRSEPGMEAVFEYARRHHEIIARFGRFPHRNQALGRTSTAEELAFLQKPGSSF